MCVCVCVCACVCVYLKQCGLPIESSFSTAVASSRFITRSGVWNNSMQQPWNISNAQCITLTCYPTYRPDMQPSWPDMQPSWPDTQPSRPDTQPSRPDTQPSRPDTQPSRADTQPSRPDTQPSRPDTQPSQPNVRVRALFCIQSLFGHNSIPCLPQVHYSGRALTRSD